MNVKQKDMERLNDYLVKVNGRKVNVRSRNEESAKKSALFCLYERNEEAHLNGLMGKPFWWNMSKEERYQHILDKYTLGKEVIVKQTKRTKRRI